jgi:hypothetical protein
VQQQTMQLEVASNGAPVTGISGTIASTDASTIAVSPSTFTFNSSGTPITITVTGKAAGDATISANHYTGALAEVPLVCNGVAVSLDSHDATIIDTQSARVTVKAVDAGDSSKVVHGLNVQMSTSSDSALITDSGVTGSGRAGTPATETRLRVPSPSPPISAGTTGRTAGIRVDDPKYSYNMLDIPANTETHFIVTVTDQDNNFNADCDWISGISLNPENGHGHFSLSGTGPNYYDFLANFNANDYIDVSGPGSHTDGQSLSVH